MKKSVFLGILSCAVIISFLSLIFTYVCIFQTSGDILSVDFLPLAVPLAFFAVFVFLTAMICFIAVWTSIHREIERINPESPDEKNDNICEELLPLAKKLASQHRLITRKSEELNFRKTEFSAITDNMSEGMIIINSDAEILSYNKSAQDILTGSSPLPKSITAVNLGQAFRSAVADALTGKNSGEMIKMGEKYYSFIINPVIHENIVEGAVIVILDETEKESREILRREFTSNISHELKTPLTSISGFAELIESGMADGGDEKRFAGKIYKEAQRLIVLVGDIIRLSQLDGGEIPFDEENPDLFAIASIVAERLENVAQKNGVKINLAGESTRIKGNAHILEEMIYNLADNGIKYNNPGGFVTLSVRSDQNKICFSCSDNGIGIPEDRKERVFERFYRVDKSHSREIGGTGLGLSIVKHGALYHSASIDLVTKLGEGTNVIIYFPKC